MNDKKKDPKRDRMIAATAWFSVLAHSHLRNDFRKAAEAQAELGRLGIVVKFKRGPLRVRP